jgi:cysteinyl-tRNA synthetase
MTCIAKPLVGLLALATSFACSSPSEPGPGDSGREQRLAAAQTWMYQIQGLGEPGALEALAATDYPLLVLEPGQNFKDLPNEMSEIISTLRTAPDGTERLLLAYVDIGQAEDYRDYWLSSWVAPTEIEAGSPEFLLSLDPDGWSGNYVVAYWDTRWKNMWIGNDGIVAELARAGFDGIYLDWVEAYDDEGIIALANDSSLDEAEEMLWFIEELDEAGEAINEDFLIVAQNAPYLIDADPTWYGKIINALAVEDTWWHGDGDVGWDDPRAGDLHERHEGDYTTPARLKQYEQYTNRGIPVFTVDYCLDTNNAAQVYRDSRAAGLRPLVTQVSLEQNTETPPSDF